jgi:hypothetical protein
LGQDVFGEKGYAEAVFQRLKKISQPIKVEQARSTSQDPPPVEGRGAKLETWLNLCLRENLK